LKPSNASSLAQSLPPIDEIRGELIRRSLRRWCVYKGFEPAAHHELIISELERVARGEIDRLALFLPPGSAKSTYASVLFPPWYLAQRPSASIIAASHTAELAERWGRRVRGMIAEDASVLRVGISAASSAAGRWETDKGGEYFAAGVGGSVTGRRADLAIIDDPIRSREDADSKLIREKQWEWWRYDLQTRLKPGAAVILIQTRWHYDDLAGRLLAEDAERWRVVKLPMEATANDDPLGRALGEPLWPEWFTEDMRVEAKRDTRVWSALYQQEPVPDEGDYFRSDWIIPVTNIPPRSEMRIYGGSDYAVTSEGGDFTVHAVVGLDADDNLYLLDIWRKQAASDEWVDAWCDLVTKWRPMEWAEETGQIKSGVGPFLERRARERRAYCVRTQFPTRGDKAVRAQSIRGRMALGGLRVPAAAAWRNEFVAELLRFPAGVHDDQVDAIGLCGQLLDKMVSGQRKAQAGPAKTSGYSSPIRRNDTSPLTL
jgi:predicted phage terminase large subunit-like protein